MQMFFIIKKKKVVCCGNAFVWKCGVSHIIPHLTMAEGMVLDFNFHFRVMHGEFFQTFECNDNTIAPRTADDVTLRPAGNIQGIMRFFSMASGKVLNHQCKDVTVLKMPIGDISKLYFVANEQKSINRLKFGYRQNSIDHLISVGVENIPNNTDEADATENTDEVIQHEVMIENEEGETRMFGC